MKTLPVPKARTWISNVICCDLVFSGLRWLVVLLIFV